MEVKGWGYYRNLNSGSRPPVELALMILRKGAARLVLAWQELRTAHDRKMDYLSLIFIYGLSAFTGHHLIGTLSL